MTTISPALLAPPRSVVGRAYARQAQATIPLKLLPLTAILFAVAPTVGVLFAFSNVVWLLALFTWDLVVLLRTVCEKGRMKRGLPPKRRGVDYGIGLDQWWTSIQAQEPYRAPERKELAAIGSPSLAAEVIARNVLWRLVMTFAMAFALGLVGGCLWVAGVYGKVWC